MQLLVLHRAYAPTPLSNSSRVEAARPLPREPEREQWTSTTPPRFCKVADGVPTERLPVKELVDRIMAEAEALIRKRLASILG